MASAKHGIHIIEAILSKREYFIKAGIVRPIWLLEDSMVVTPGSVAEKRKKTLHEVGKYPGNQ